MKIDQQWVKDQINQIDGFAAGAKQVLQMIANALAQEEKEGKKET